VTFGGPLGEGAACNGKTKLLTNKPMDQKPVSLQRAKNKVKLDVDGSGPE
jgi:hypothetical protein